MARQAKLKISVRVSVEESETDRGIGGTSRLLHEFEVVEELRNGTDDDQVSRVYSDHPTVTTTPTELDLVGTALNSNLNAAWPVSFADLCLIAAKNKSAAGNLLVGGGTLAGPFLSAGEGVTLPPGGFFLWYAPGGIAPGAGTSDVLELAASAGSVESEILLAGRHQ